MAEGTISEGTGLGQGTAGQQDERGGMNECRGNDRNNPQVSGEEGYY